MSTQRDLFDTQMDLMDQLHNERQPLWATPQGRRGTTIVPDAPGHPECEFKVFVKGIKVATIPAHEVRLAMKEHLDAICQPHD